MIKFVTRKIYNVATDSKFSEIFSGSAWALGARILTAASGLISQIIIARLYGAEVIGIVALINSFLIIATIFTVLGTSTSIMRFIPEHIVKYSVRSAFKVYHKMLILIVTVSIFTGTLFLVFSNWFALTLFSKPQFASYLFLASFFVVFKSMIIFNTNAIRALKLIKMFAYMEFFPSFSNLLVLILLTLVAYQREVPIYARLSSFLITGLASWFVMEYAFKRMAKDGDRIHPLPMRSILKVSVPMFLTSTMYLVMGQIGVLMIGAFRTEAEVGYFSVAVKLATLSSFVINTINTIAAPKFSELYYSKKFDDLFYVARKAAKLVLWTTFPIIIGLLVFGMLVLKYIFGSEFSVAYPAMAIMLSGQLVISMLGSAEKFLNMTGQQKTLGYILIGGTLANVILNFILIPIYGILGASLATVCGNLFWNISAMIYIKAHYGKSIAYIPGFLRRPRNIKFGQ